MTHKVIDTLKFKDDAIKVGDYNDCYNFIRGTHGYSIIPLTKAEKEYYERLYDDYEHYDNLTDEMTLYD